MFLGSIFTTNVYAESFYEGEYIDGIYMNKYQYSTKTIYFQKARFFRKSGTNEFAYCIEPFRFFEDNKTYTPTVNPRNLSKTQIDRISKIAHFGYGYKNHSAAKWYAITQFMIWQAADSSGDYYFTDSLNGNRINPYQAEINEINNLITNYGKTPSFSNKAFTVVEDHNLVLEDTNKVLSNFKTDNKELSINSNKLTINKLKEGKYSLKLYKQDNYYNKPIIFYQSNESQNLVNTGDLSKLEVNLNINVIKTLIEINKIDKDTQSITPRGEAILDGAIYKLYDSNNNLVDTLTIKDNQARVDNLSFGKYYLIEDTAGIGYTINTNKYEINITESNNKSLLTVENKVIEKKVIIEKKYGEKDKFIGEENISFNILNNKNELIKTITTDKNGIAEITLPYGKYKIIQVNSTSGYQKVDAFTLEVKDSNDELIELKDMKIPVPDTHSKKNNLLLLIFQLLMIIL